MGRILVTDFGLLGPRLTRVVGRSSAKRNLNLAIRRRATLGTKQKDSVVPAISWLISNYRSRTKHCSSGGHGVILSAVSGQWFRGLAPVIPPR